MSIILKSTQDTSARTYKKIMIHGNSGIGKTMLSATLGGFKPVIILTEKNGDESLAPDNIVEVFGADREDILYDLPIIEAYEPRDFEEAVRFVNESEEFDVVVFDSMSKVSRLILKAAKSNNSHGMKAYGEHNDSAMALIEDLLDGDKHVVMYCHTSRQEDSDTGEVCYFPSFEGNKFAERVVYDMPHVLFMEDFIDDDGVTHKTLRARKGDSNKRVKTRGNSLDELNEPHLGRLLQRLIHGKNETKPKTKKAK